MNEFREYVKIKIINKVVRDCLNNPKQILRNVNSLSKELKSDKPLEDILYDTIGIQILDKHLLKEWCIQSEFSKTSFINHINNFSRDMFLTEIRNSMLNNEYVSEFKDLATKCKEGIDISKEWKDLIVKILDLDEFNLTLVNELTYYNMNEMISCC